MNGRTFFRVAFALLAFAPSCSAQHLPAFNWVEEVDGSGMDQFAGMGTDAQGNIYLAGSTTSPNFPVKAAVQNHLTGVSNCFVTKLDPSGNVLYSTYFGGGFETALAMTVDPAGDVYVTGFTGTGFPTTPGAYSPNLPPPFEGPTVNAGGTAFLFKLNPDGSLGFSTYFASRQSPLAIAVGQSGSVWIAGSSYGGLPTTPNAYQTTYCCAERPGSIFYVPEPDAFLARFDPAASTLLFATYLNVPGAIGLGVALAVGPDDTAYVGSNDGINRIDPTGSSLLASFIQLGPIQALAIAPDGSLYAAGVPNEFQPPAGAFQTIANPLPNLPDQEAEHNWDAIVRLDPTLQSVIAGTYFYSFNDSLIASLTLDAAGDVYVGGTTTQGLPTRTPFQQGFGVGFMSELSGDLTTLLFSSYFGGDYTFHVAAVAADSNGSTIIAGPDTGNTWVNSLALTPPPPLRIDSVVNAASLLNGQISPGETIFVQGAGFGGDSQLLVNGMPVPVLSIGPAQIAATFPAGFSGTAAVFEVRSGNAASNQLLVSVATTTPGIFAANGAGYGQGYILNNDGTLNTPSNPAAPGDRITIYAAGVGPVSFTDGYAVTQYPVNVFIDGIYCDGVAAVMGPKAGFPGDVYQLTVYVPNTAILFANKFTFPPLDPVILQIKGVASQTGLAISIGSPQ